MAIIINLGGALSVAIVFTIIVLALEYLPPFGSSPLPNLLVGLLTFVIGAVLDFTPLKARVFFLPVWFIGILIICYQLWAIWHWVGLLISVLVIAAGLFVLYRLANRHLAEKTKTIITGRAQLLSELNSMDDLKARTSLLAAFLGDPLQLVSAEAVRHNLEILREIKSRYGTLFIPEKTSVVDAYAKTLNDALSRAKFSWKDFRETEAVQKILTSTMTS